MREFGEWMSRVGEAVAVLTMAHDDPTVKVVSNVVHYAASRRDDINWNEKWIGALGDRNENGEDPQFVRLKPSYFE